MPSEINLPWSMKFFFNFVLDDMYVYVRGDGFKAELGGVSLKVKIDVPPFKKSRFLSTRFRSSRMSRSSSIRGRIDLSFQSDAAGVEPPLVMGWKLLYTGKGMDLRILRALSEWGRTERRYGSSSIWRRSISSCSMIFSTIRRRTG